MNIEIRGTNDRVIAEARDAFAGFDRARSGSPAVAAAREAALDRFARSGLPHRRLEDWKYTDLRGLMRSLPPLARPVTPAPVDAETLSEIDAHRILVRDGEVFVPEELRQIAGVRIATVADLLSQNRGEALIEGFPDEVESPVLDLNTGLFGDGVVVEVASGTALDRPLHIAHVTTAVAPQSVYLRSLVTVAEDASATIIETYEGPDGVAYVVNGATRLVAGSGAQVKWLRQQRDGDAAINLSTLAVEIGEGATVTLSPFTTGGALSRNQISVRFDGSNANLNFAGIHLLTGRQHGDTTLFVDHAQPHNISRELFKSVLDGRSRGVFQGKILVRQDAQKTDGRMMSQALMLSDRCEADIKPELEIYADDVQCGHGATSGRIDEELLFYLRARGIPERQAQALLIEAFIGEAVEALEDEAIGEALMRYAHQWVADQQDEEE